MMESPPPFTLSLSNRPGSSVLISRVSVPSLGTKQTVVLRTKVGPRHRV